MKRSRLKPMSAKRQATLNERRRVVAAVLNRDGGCVARWLVPDVRCRGPFDVDEILPRGVGGDPLDPSNCQTLCRAHHDWKHAHPAEAERLGLRARWKGTE